MTSANISDEPLIINNQEAMESYRGCDFPLHNLEIATRVMTVNAGAPLFTPSSCAGRVVCAGH